LAPSIKEICKRYGVKATIGVHNYSTLVLNVKSSDIDFIGNYNATIEERDPTGNKHINRAKTSIQVNPYWYHEQFTGRAKYFLREVIEAMKVGNHDNSDIQSDFVDVGWYVDVNIGQWDKPYILTK